MIHRIDYADHCGCVTLGNIDEDISAVFEQLGRANPLRSVVFECEGVSRITSAGIRGWTEGMKLLPRGASVAYRKCTPALIEAATMIPNFFGSGSIDSFLLTYNCEDCNVFQTMAIHVKNGQALLPQAPLCACGREIMPDDHEVEQFEFVMDSR